MADGSAGAERAVRTYQAMPNSHDSGSPILMDTPGKGLSALAGLGRKQSFTRGEYVYQQGQVSSVFYQLLSGRVRVFISRPDGSQRLLGIVEPGATFGESSCFDRLPYYASAQAMVTSIARVLRRNDVLRAAQNDPSVSLDIFRALVRKQRLLAVEAASVALRSRDRVLMMLEHLTEAYGRPEEDGWIRLSVGVSTEELASLIGVTRVTLSRDISSLVKMGLLKKNGRDILVRTRSGPPPATRGPQD